MQRKTHRYIDFLQLCIDTPCTVAVYALPRSLLPLKTRPRPYIYFKASCKLAWQDGLFYFILLTPLIIEQTRRIIDASPLWLITSTCYSNRFALAHSFVLSRLIFFSLSPRFRFFTNHKFVCLIFWDIPSELKPA